MKNEESLRTFLHKAAGIRHKGLRKKRLIQAYMKIADAEIETRLGLPQYTIELQRIVETRRATVKELERESKRNGLHPVYSTSS